jgi:hypothetical protein
VISESVGSSRHGIGFWIALVVGTAIMGLAVGGAYGDLTTESFGSWGKWIIGADLVNDFLILPLVAGIGVGLTKVPLGRWRAPVQAGLFASAIVLIVGYPGIRELSASSNPTIQPLNYATATLTALGVVWAVVLAWAVLRHRRAVVRVDHGPPAGDRNGDRAS